MRKVSFEGVLVTPSVKLFHTFVKNCALLAMQIGVWLIPKSLRVVDRKQLQSSELERQWDAWALADKRWVLGGRSKKAYICMRTLYFSFLNSDANWQIHSAVILAAYAKERKWIE